MSQPPLIGIEVDLLATETGRRYAKCYEAYFDAVVDAGGAPVLLPPCPDPVFETVLGRVDGVVVPGGDDFSAEEWGEEQRPCERFVPSDARRLEFGRRLIRLVLEAERPFLGVCYGAQLLNIARGGTLVQDIPQQVAGCVEHARTFHEIEVVGESLLGRLVGEGRPVEVNSRHHQAIGTPGADLLISARAPDGVVEAIEGSDPARFLLGVQWHPEELGARPSGMALFAGLVEAARRARMGS